MHERAEKLVRAEKFEGLSALGLGDDKNGAMMLSMWTSVNRALVSIVQASQLRKIWDMRITKLLTSLRFAEQ